MESEQAGELFINLFIYDLLKHWMNELLPFNYNLKDKKKIEEVEDLAFQHLQFT